MQSVFQWHNILTEFYENQSFGSELNSVDRFAHGGAIDEIFRAFPRILYCIHFHASHAIPTSSSLSFHWNVKFCSTSPFSNILCEAWHHRR
jgi:hypothetical protein